MNVCYIPPFTRRDISIDSVFDSYEAAEVLYVMPGISEDHFVSYSSAKICTIGKLFPCVFPVNSVVMTTLEAMTNRPAVDCYRNKQKLLKYPVFVQCVEVPGFTFGYSGYFP